MDPNKPFAKQRKKIVIFFSSFLKVEKAV